MSQHKATFTSIHDENVICPICGVTILDMGSEEGWTSLGNCPHFVCCFLWVVNIFDTVHPAVEQWWEAHEQAVEEADEFLEFHDLVYCPVIDHLIEHNMHGMACGPACLTASFGFAINPPSLESK